MSKVKKEKQPILFLKTKLFFCDNMSQIGLKNDNYFKKISPYITWHKD